jgi:hypothetical protein
MTKGLGDEIDAARPSGLLVGDHRVHLNDPRRWKGARKRRGCAGRKGERRRIIEVEITLDVTVGATTIAELQHMMMFQLVDQRWIVDLNELVIAVIVGKRHEEVERMSRRQQRSRGFPRRAHRGYRVIHQPRHDAAGQRRPEPARAHQQRELLAHLHVADRGQHACFGGAPEKGLEEPFAPHARTRVRRKQHRDIGIVEPEIAHCRHRQVVTERARQHRAVDAAGRRTGNDVDNDAELQDAADVAQEFEVNGLSVVFRVSGIRPVGECGLCAARPVGDGVQRGRGTHQLQDLLGDTMHIDGERNAAEADQRNAKLFLAQG